ncbi:Rpn family recombination-promoting nuclease/putative transposase [Clostridium sp. MSJ-8]|uniref:Rpn family recombination-promoting nuclease/putative transposase n=1 Tax=Clostridium sp. MSJ-8 TaxID=2841510 RepID=UPI001C0EC69B|nr:Rpn family recombination-promoting nuclease/putative transposase [Clostridium sp. MSJ-8]MBU5488037.1 Rpn family recombination-promoting nuclease/putative transposase [Clostridium sp. MSJ-8]
MTKEYNRDIYHLHDKSYKDLYSKKEIAADLFKNIIKTEWAQHIDADKLTLVNKSYVTSDYEETECDIVYTAEIEGTEMIFYILLEFQSRVDYTMPLRLLFYMTEILREYSKNANHKKHDRTMKIPAVIPIVLYNGEKVWDVPKEFRKIIYKEKLFGDGLINFTYDIIDVNNDLDKEELINSNNVSSAIFLLDQKIDAIEFLNRIQAIALFFSELSEVETKALKHWIRNTVENRLAEVAIDILEADREDVELMVANNAFILKDMREKSKAEGKIEGREEGIKEGRIEGKAEGRAEGIKEGIKEGLKEGLKEGIKKGVREGKIESAINLFELGVPIETVIKATGLSEEEIKKALQNKNR